MKKRYPLLLLSVFFTLTGFAQTLSRTAYEKADEFLWRNSRGKIHNLRVVPHWNSENGSFWYELTTAEGSGIFIYHPKSKKSVSPFDFEKVKAAIRLEMDLTEGVPVQLRDLERKSEGVYILVTSKGKFEVSDGSVRTIPEEKQESDPLKSKSPSGDMTAYSRDYNLVVEKDGREVQLSTSGYRDFEYGSYYGWFDLMEGESGERPPRFGVSWSPDSRYLLTAICDTRNASKMYMLDWSKDSLFRPRLLGYYRGSPGDTNVVMNKQVLFDVQNEKEIELHLPFASHIADYNFWWFDNNRLVGMKHSRGFKNLHLISILAETGHVDTLYSETSSTNVDTQHLSVRMLKSQNKVLFTSENDGWNHIYTVDLETRKITQLTSGAFFVNSVKAIDEDRGVVYFMAGGFEKDSNPYLLQLLKVNLDGSKLTLLTPEPYNHDVSLSPDYSYFVDNYSRIDSPTKTVVRRARDGKVISEISEADTRWLDEQNWSGPQGEVIELADGTPLWAAIWKPTNFDPSVKYPIVDHSYTGPHTHVYPTTFASGISSSSNSLAELGFVVIRINGRGSAGRSKQFHNFSYKRLGYTLGDHVTVIKELARRYPWIDDSKVGIYGHSAGGYDAAHALLQYPDFYKVAVSSSADHDHRMEKAWWPEMYMGWPVDTAYHNQSNITMAGNLQGKLLITHGGLDDNVNASATFKLAEALVRANKQFDMLIFPSQRHGYQGTVSDYFTLKRWNYFVEHLTDSTPDLSYQLKQKE